MARTKTKTKRDAPRNALTAYPPEYEEADADSRALAIEDSHSNGKNRGARAMALAIPELGQISPSYPIRWIEIDESDWPYANPAEEFIRSPCPISLHELSARWEGLWKSFQIESEYIRAAWPTQRRDYQDKILDQALLSSRAGDIEYQKRVLNEDIMNAEIFMQRLMGDIVQGIEYRPTRSAAGTGYLKMPMTAESKAKLINAYQRMANMRATRMNIATQISKKELEAGNNLTDLIRRARAESDPAYASLLNLSGLGGSVFDSQAQEIGAQSEQKSLLPPTPSPLATPLADEPDGEANEVEDEDWNDYSNGSNHN